ncbi:3-hydroxylacyl-ACP dehydratase [Acidocella aromatica]|uniref:Putative hotdog family 3-hydroxylacyl-ACP dehydratase n=1 Tax=Acidocella aromatica TaxID=1303579 RepID=A0A840VLA8_9PROT|nr:3-hydroxylacyl-ACP dehydratase [Acidocella aromatica]MBB5373935.1 putative hotdog family 3-hydroxylacyl-ACP dehydratase [Acidocella aromatica]
MSIGHEQIQGMIPHSGTMCLLDEVLDWDAASVRCLSRRYRNAENPLRRPDGTLGTACGIEIAAQAMAVHGRLTAPEDGVPVPGYLVSLRDVRLASPLLDDTKGPLLIEAKLLMGDGSGATYEFAVTSQGTPWLSGRATVLFGAEK